MRLRLLGLLFLLAPSAVAQEPAPVASAGSVKHWILFTDKPAGQAAEPDRLTERALRRRALRGSTIPAGVDAPVSPAYLERLEEIGVEPLVRSRWLNGISAYLTPEQAEAVRALPFVGEMREVGRLIPGAREETVLEGLFGVTAAPAATSVVFSPALDYGPSEKQLSVMNAVAPLERGINGTGVVLGFLDTLFDFDHPAFEQHRAEGRIKEVRDFTEIDQQIHGGNQSDYHGLSTSSVATGYAPGQLIAPGHGATVYAATTEFAPHERNQEEDNFVAGLEWLESQGVDVVNVSLGYTTFDPNQRSYTYEDLDGDTGITTRAADRAVQLGVVMVVSAGNDGSGKWHYIGTPADGDSVIAVGAVRPDSVRASFSSFGPAADGRIKPDVSALGQWITRDGVAVGPYVARRGGNYGVANGTSFASPLVAGVVTQLLQVDSTLRPMDVREILRRTAHLAENPNNELGWGIVDADAAVRMAETWDPTKVEPDIPEAFEMASVYPNPFSESITFGYNAPAAAPAVRVTVYDALGRAVLGPVEDRAKPGPNTLTLTASGLPSGVYFYRLDGEGVSAAGTVVLAR